MRRFIALTSALTLLATSIFVSVIRHSSPAQAAATSEAPSDLLAQQSPDLESAALVAHYTAVPVAVDREAQTAQAHYRASRALAQRKLIRARIITQHRQAALRAKQAAAKARAVKARAVKRAAQEDAPTGWVGGAWRSMGTIRTTEYCWTGNQTADSKWPTIGMVAVLDRGIPFGSLIKVEGMGTYVVDDWIGHGSDIDIYAGRYGCETQAADYGRRYRQVWILHR